jgi:hypothetical protein
MDQPNWNDLHTADEWADLLDDLAEKAAHERGVYDEHSNLKRAAECIRDLAERVEKASELAASLTVIVEDTQRKARAALESLSRLPS